MRDDENIKPRTLRNPTNDNGKRGKPSWSTVYLDFFLHGTSRTFSGVRFSTGIVVSLCAAPHQPVSPTTPSNRRTTDVVDSPCRRRSSHIVHFGSERRAVRKCVSIVYFFFLILIQFFSPFCSYLAYAYAYIACDRPQHFRQTWVGFLNFLPILMLRIYSRRRWPPRCRIFRLCRTPSDVISVFSFQLSVVWNNY